MNTVADRKRSLMWASQYGRNARRLWDAGDHEAAIRVWKLAWGRAHHALGRRDHPSSDAWMHLFAAVIHKAINDGASEPEPVLAAMRRGNFGHHDKGRRGQSLTLEMAQGFIGAARNWVRSIYGQKRVEMRKIEAFWNDPRCACGRRVEWPAVRCEVCQRKEDERLERLERERDEFLVWCAMEGAGDE